MGANSVTVFAPPGNGVVDAGFFQELLEPALLQDRNREPRPSVSGADFIAISPIALRELHIV